ncbi:MAG: 2Fe-2S iron-sulfur cluster binding domain-containing protein [Rhodospirillales bacterium]|nr:2Fe-2S iron-sulfur cluster binding domain-containing protein [Rhodospirillales bacterium]
MPQVTFIQPDGHRQTVQAEENWSIMQIALAHKIPGIEGACGGNMSCATCHVYIHPDWVERLIAQDNEISDQEEDLLDTAKDLRETSRLGCQIKITGTLDGLIVALPGSKEWP